MRSSNSKSGRSVSICNESYPNGPCSKKDGEAGKRANEGCGGSENEASNDSGEDDRQHAKVVASKVVEDIVRLASTAANEKLAESSESPSCSSTSTSHLDISFSAEINQNQTPITVTNNELHKSENLKRLPTIQIDTVPSVPSSPTEWQAPSSEDIILEEGEIIDEDHIELAFDSSSKDSRVTSEIQDFATCYVKDIITKAMDLSKERLKSQDTEAAKEIASKVVGDIINQANDKAFEKLKDGLDFPENVPCIQIDTVPSMPPSPTSEEEDDQKYTEPPVKEPLKRKKFIFHDDDDEDDVKPPPKVPSLEDIPCIQIDTVPSRPSSPTEEECEENIEQVVKPPVRRKKFIFRDEDDDDVKPKKVQKLIKHADAPIEIKEFASSYVKDIISKAITMAEEKLVSSVPFNFEDVNMMKVSGPWYIRAREALLRVLRSACFCTPRRHDS